MLLDVLIAHQQIRMFVLYATTLLDITMTPQLKNAKHNVEMEFW